MNGLRKMCKLLISEPDRVLARNRASRSWAPSSGKPRFGGRTCGPRKPLCASTQLANHRYVFIILLGFLMLPASAERLVQLHKTLILIAAGLCQGEFGAKE